MPTKTPPLPELELHTRDAWRRWLGKHHASSAGVWLVLYKGHTGVQSMSLDDAVREALCFGWIDSLIRRLDERRYALRFMPRKPASRWSAINRRRWAELEATGLLAAAGRAAAPAGRPYAAPRKFPALPAYFAKALRAHPKAWKFFRTLAPGYRRLFVGWVHLAKRPETRAKRIRESIALLAAGKKLGMK